MPNHNRPSQRSTADVGAPSPIGTWGPDAAGLPRLDLMADGSFAGTDGCNRLFGLWSQEDQEVRFSGVGSTRMACVDVDTWLERLDSATVDGDLLRISNADGTEIGALERSE